MTYVPVCRRELSFINVQCANDTVSTTQHRLPEIAKCTIWLWKYSFDQPNSHFEEDRDSYQFPNTAVQLIFCRRRCSKEGLFCKSLLSASFNFWSSSKFSSGSPGMTSGSIFIASRMSVASSGLPSRSCCDRIFLRRIYSGLNVFTARPLTVIVFRLAVLILYTEGVGANFGGQRSQAAPLGIYLPASTTCILEQCGRAG